MQRFRGQTWYVLQDHQSGRFHRLSPSAYLLVNLMNGRRSLDEIWQLAGERLGDNQPTQDETIRLLAQLHSADLLQGDLSPDIAELAYRADRRVRAQLLSRVRNPLALRFAMIDPDRFLSATLPLVRPVFTRLGFLLWLAIVGWAIFLAAVHWPELTSNITDRVLAAESIILMVVIYPIVKAIHEMGHGYATKIWGGEVHEMGIMVLVLFPIPYVDASASSAFRQKWRRALVGGAGIMVEMLIASVAMILWVDMEPGLARAAAFSTMLVAGVSTVLFNGNPLLRFDGYYVLADLIEVPNLGTRANRYLQYLGKRYILGMADAESPVTGPGERGWFFCYGIAAFVYRLFIFAAISLFVATKLFFVGVLLAIWAVVNTFIWPALKALKFLATDAQLRRRRGWAVTRAGLAVGAITVLLCIVPLPYSTVTEGIVWVPEHAIVRAQTSGVVVDVAARPDENVVVGQPLVVLDDPDVRSREQILEARRREILLRLKAAEVANLVDAQVLRERAQDTEVSLEFTRGRIRDLTVRSAGDGRLVLPAVDDLRGRFLNQGDLIGYVVGGEKPTVRVIVTPDVVDLVRERTQAVEVRFAERLEQVLSADIVREAPAAIEDLPSKALSTIGGGQIALDPSDPEAQRTLQRLFQFELSLRDPLPIDSVGGRVYVRFSYDSEPIAWRIGRGIRQLFLRRLDV